MIKLICEQCGKEYSTKPYMAHISEHHFCSQTCYGHWQKINRIGVGRKRIKIICYTCGKEFEKRPSDIHKHNFCSKYCYTIWRKSSEWCGINNPTWLGGNINYRGGNWDKQRTKARKRDNNICQNCGKKADNLPVHHIKPFHLFNNYREANDINNLITLCSSCHTISDIQYWKDNPNEISNRKFPDCLPVYICKICGNEFKPRSGRSIVCDNCCTITCEYCGKTFYSRRITHRKVKYCSKECRNKTIKRKEKICIGCGKIFLPKKITYKYCSNICHLKNDPPRHKAFVITQST